MIAFAGVALVVTLWATKNKNKSFQERLSNNTKEYFKN